MAQWTCFHADEPSGWSHTDFDRFVAEHDWIFASTMPHNPHEYTLRRQTTTASFEAAVRFIREHGVLEQYAGKPYKTLARKDHRYWTMGAPLEDTILINRKYFPGQPMQAPREEDKRNEAGSQLTAVLEQQHAKLERALRLLHEHT